MLTRDQVNALLFRGLTQPEALVELGMTRHNLAAELRRLGMRWVKTATHCRYGHDRRVHGYTDAAGQRRCKLCAREVKVRYCIRHNGAEPKQRDADLSAAQVMEKLDHAVALECAPPWVRHPQPWE